MCFYLPNRIAQRFEVVNSKKINFGFKRLNKPDKFRPFRFKSKYNT